MKNGEIVIKTLGLSKELIEAMKKIPSVNNLKRTYLSFDSVQDFVGKNKSLKFTKNAIQILILNEIPLCQDFHFLNDRIVFCTKMPDSLIDSDLALLYELWPAPLTAFTIKFLFNGLLFRIRFEINNQFIDSEYHRRVLEMARQDYLTGLATRWYLKEYTDNHDEEKNFTCIYFDMDRFKQVNDTYGHQIGDQILSLTARMIKQDFQDGFAVRLGGDEFLVVIYGLIPIYVIENRVNEFFKKLFSYYKSNKITQNLSMSAGISQSTFEEYKSIETLIHESDVALYQAKNAGRACCRVYNSLIKRRA